MKKRLLLLLTYIGITCFSLISCTDDQSSSGTNVVNGGNNNAPQITNNTKFILNASNVASYFDVDVTDARNVYDKGYVFRYKVSVSTKGRYKTSGKVTLKFKASFKYTYKPGANASNRTLTSTSNGTLTLESNQTSGSKEYTVSFSAKMKELISCYCSGYFTEASGNLVKY